MTLTWPNDLDTQSWPRYGQDIPSYQKWSSYVKQFKSYSLNRQMDRQTDRHTEADNWWSFWDSLHNCCHLQLQLQICAHEMCSTLEHMTFQISSTIKHSHLTVSFIYFTDLALVWRLCFFHNPPCLFSRYIVNLDSLSCCCGNYRSCYSHHHSSVAD